MDTVRAFVDNVSGTKSGQPDQGAVYNRMDRGANFLDLRRLMLVETGDRPRLDFYELYWQPTFGGGSPGAVLGWVLRVLLRRARGPQMQRVVRTVRVFLAVLMLTIAALAAFIVFGPMDSWKGYVAAAVPLLAAVWWLIWLVLKSVLANVVADASRWFSPGPSDIEGRDKVRKQGMELLKEAYTNGPQRTTPATTASIVSPAQSRRRRLL